MYLDLVGKDTFYGLLASLRGHLFRAQLILHDKVREVFEQSLRLSQEQGYLKGKARDAGGDGHHVHPGPRCGEGHLSAYGG